MNSLKERKRQLLLDLLSRGVGAREAARLAGVNRETATRYRRKWIDDELQRAYDLLCDGDGEACDAITAKLPDKEVRGMLDNWLKDQCGNGPKSRWY